VGHRRGTVLAIATHHGIQPVKLAVMFLAFKRVEHFLDLVINKGHLQLNRRVVGDVIAERPNRTVIIRLNPCAHQVREPINEHLRASFFGIGKEQVFPGFLDKHTQMFRICLAALHRWN